MRKIFYAVILILGATSSGCQLAPTSPGTVIGSASQHLLVLNGLANTFSMVGLVTASTLVNAAPTGSIPNEIHARGNSIYVVNSGNNTLQVYSVTPIALVGVISLGAGCNPWSLVFENDSTAYCSCLQSHELLKLNINTLQVANRRTIPASAGKYPEGLALVNGKLYTAMTASSGCGQVYSCGDGTSVAVLDLSDFAGNAFSTISVNLNPQALALDASNRVHALSTGDYWSTWGYVDVIDPSTDTVTNTLPCTPNYSPGLMSIAANGNAFIAGFPGAMVYNANTLSGGVSLFDGANAYAGVSTANGKAYYSDFLNDLVREFDDTTFAAGSTYNVGDGPGDSVYIP
jgi:hypothetical protein